MNSGDNLERDRASIRATCASRTAKSLLKIMHNGSQVQAAMYAWSRFKGCLNKEAPHEQDVAVAVAWEDLMVADKATWLAREPVVTVSALAIAFARYLAANQVQVHQYPAPMATPFTCLSADQLRSFQLRTRDYYRVGPYSIPRWQGEEGASFVRLDDMPAHLADAAHQYQGDVPQSLPRTMATEVFEAFLCTQPNQVELDLLAGYQVSSPPTSPGFLSI